MLLRKKPVSWVDRIALTTQAKTAQVKKAQTVTAQTVIAQAWAALTRTSLALGLVGVLALAVTSASAQEEPSRDDILRGAIGPARACYDVKTYDLDIRIDPKTRSVRGSNRIEFTAVENFDVMQVDLFKNMEVDKIEFGEDTEASFTREENSIFIELPDEAKQGNEYHVTIHYSGSPIIARRPPWSGGFTWAEDPEGNPWVVVTCQGTGASLWWPNKDHPADEPESMKLSVTVPPGLEEVSNGRLKKRTELDDGWTKFDWEISYPINNYCVTINIAKYAHFSDEYVNADGETLTLDYYVLPENVDKAKNQFEQTKDMLAIFEKYFGKYPFYRDGFKLIECPHPGMEHQSAIAYGNRFENGYLGRASSDVGRKFDFILIHEAAHEWWGNSVTKTDNADLWIHESFGAYAESLFVEDLYGYDQALEYINGKKSNVRNQSPIIGEYNVNKSGAGDMYDKGQLALNTLRHVIDDDKVWFDILLGIQTEFKYQNVTAADLIDYIHQNAGQEYDYFWDQYFRQSDLPRLELELLEDGEDLNVRYRWNADVESFEMPVEVTTAPEQFERITPKSEWQTMTLKGMSAEEFQVNEDRFYLIVERR